MLFAVVECVVGCGCAFVGVCACRCRRRCRMFHVKQFEDDS